MSPIKKNKQQQVIVKATNPIALNDRQVAHYGLDRASKKVVNGEIVLDSELTTDYDPLESWTVYTVPSLYEIIKKIILPISSKDYSLLESLGFELEYRGRSAVSGYRLLSQIGITAEGKYAWDDIPLNIAVCPKLVLANLIANDGFMDQDGPILGLVDRLVYPGSITPNLVRIGTDIFRVHSDRAAKEWPITIKKARVLEAPKKQPNRLFKARYVEPSTDSQDALMKQMIGIKTFYDAGPIRLWLAPSKNRGKHIATLKLQDKRSGSVESIGSIRHSKGKLFCSVPAMLADKADRARLQDAMDRASYSSDQLAAKKADLSAKIKALGAEIQTLKAKSKGVSSLKIGLDIRKLEIKRQGLIEKLTSVNTDRTIEADQLRSAVHPIDPEISIHLLGLMKSLGIQPNNWIKNVPQSSPLSSPRYWLDNFGVAVIYDHRSRPIEFYRDFR